MEKATQEQPLPNDPLFPTKRAFIVQFRRDSGVDAVQGRVEHVVSGQSAKFTSTADLLTFMTELIRHE